MAEGTGEGAYLLAEALELGEHDEILLARRRTQERKNKKLDDKEFERFTGSAIRRIYKAIPSRAWMNDIETDENGEYIRDIRVEVSLDTLKALVNS